MGIINGYDPDLSHVALAPQLAALAALDTTRDLVTLALLAAHPELRPWPRPSTTDVPLLVLAADLLQALADLRPPTIRYCHRLGAERLWIPAPRTPSPE